MICLFYELVFSNVYVKRQNYMGYVYDDNNQVSREGYLKVKTLNIDSFTH